MYENAKAKKKTEMYLLAINQQKETISFNTKNNKEIFLHLKKTEHFSIHFSTFAVKKNSTYRSGNALGNHVSHEYRNEQ